MRLILTGQETPPKWMNFTPDKFDDNRTANNYFNGWKS